jgi:dihydroorotase
LSQTFDLILRGAIAATPNGIAPADIGVSGGGITAIGQVEGSAAAEFDARGLHALPGVIDTQVHFREPGLTHKEDYGTGTAGAALGGVTAVFEMPNTNPNTLTTADLADKLARAKGRAWCDMAFFMGRRTRTPSSWGSRSFCRAAAGQDLHGELHRQPAGGR